VTDPRPRGIDASLHPFASLEMTDEQKKVCDICRERPATHTTYYAHTGETKALCMPCFEQNASPGELDLFRHNDKTIREGKCKYCGAPAEGGTMTFSILPAQEEETNLWCERCRLDLVEFASRPENEIPDFPVHDRAALRRVSQQLAERDRRKAEFMRQRISERGHNDAG
jgi:hypothetical protein